MPCSIRLRCHHAALFSALRHLEPVPGSAVLWRPTVGATKVLRARPFLLTQPPRLTHVGKQAPHIHIHTRTLSLVLPTPERQTHVSTVPFVLQTLELGRAFSPAPVIRDLAKLGSPTVPPRCHRPPDVRRPCAPTHRRAQTKPRRGLSKYPMVA